MFNVEKYMDQDGLSVDDDNETLIEKLIAAKRILIADYDVVTTIEGLEAEEGGFYRHPNGKFVFYAPYVLFCRLVNLLKSGWVERPVKDELDDIED